MPIICINRRSFCFGCAGITSWECSRVNGGIEMLHVLLGWMVACDFGSLLAALCGGGLGVPDCSWKEKG